MLWGSDDGPTLTVIRYRVLSHKTPWALQFEIAAENISISLHDLLLNPEKVFFSQLSEGTTNMDNTGW